MDKPVFGIRFEHDVTDHDDRRRCDTFADNHVAQIGQDCAERAGVWTCRALQHGDGRVGGKPVGYQFFGNVGGSCDPHIDDQGPALACKPRPILVGQALALASDEGNRARCVAMSEWEHRFGRTAHRRRNSGHDFDIDARVAARLGFFAAPPENERSVVEKQAGEAQILFLSNLVISKGPVILLDALSILHERKAKFRATFTGAAHPPLTPETFQAMIDYRGLRDFVTFAGPVFGRAKQHLLASSDIFAFPSYNDAFPLVVLEAMSAGLPVVATAEGAIPDMIESGVNGILVPHHDPLALADAIGVLLDNPGHRAAFGKAGRNKVMTDYSFEIFTERMSSLWSALA